MDGQSPIVLPVAMSVHSQMWMRNAFPAQNCSNAPRYKKKKSRFKALFRGRSMSLKKLYLELITHILKSQNIPKSQNI